MGGPAPGLDINDLGLEKSEVLVLLLVVLTTSVGEAIKN